jgi:polyhydroxyalkanoate synthesis regulator phasin
MPENDLLKQLLDAGMNFTALTQARAEEVIRDLVRAGAVEAEKAQAGVDELLERGRRNRERWVETARDELDQALANLNLATRDDVERMAREMADNVVSAVRQFFPERGGPTRTAAPEPPTAPAAAPAATAAKKSTARKATAKKTTARKSAAAKKATARPTEIPGRSAAAKKSAAKKAPAKKTAAKKTAARKTTAKKTTAKKATAAKRSGSARKSSGSA